MGGIIVFKYIYEVIVRKISQNRIKKPVALLLAAATALSIIIPVYSDPNSGLSSDADSVESGAAIETVAEPDVIDYGSEDSETEMNWLSEFRFRNICHFFFSSCAFLLSATPGSLLLNPLLAFYSLHNCEYFFCHFH